MKTLIFSLLFAAAPAYAVSPATADYLRSIRIDPNSEAVRVADQDGLVKTTFRGRAFEASLEQLASVRHENETRCFVATRNFIQKLKTAFASTPMLKENYDPIYLRPEEKDLAGKKVAEDFVAQR